MLPIQSLLWTQTYQSFPSAHHDSLASRLQVRRYHPRLCRKKEGTEGQSRHQMTKCNETCQDPVFLAAASHYSCECSALSHQPPGLQTITNQAGPLFLLQLCQVCPSSLHSSCFSALATLPFQALSPHLRMLKELPRLFLFLKPLLSFFLFRCYSSP